MSKISLSNTTVVVTGAAGFIGSYLSKNLLNSDSSIKIIGIDCLTDYYDVSLKEERLNMLSNYGDRFNLIKGDISDKSLIDEIF